MDDHWKPSNPGRWSALGLADPAEIPGGSVSDLLAYALVDPDAEDPIDGILLGVRTELVVLADGDGGARPMLRMLIRRLDVALLLLRRLDNRVPIPLEEDPDEAPPSRVLAAS